MKKILAYLLVLVSLMTLFCGTAGAADNSMDKNGYATTYVSMLVYDTDAKAAKYENVPVGCWTVVGRCYYGEWQADASEFALFLSHLGETLYECVKAKC